MKKIAILAAGVIFSINTMAQTWSVDKMHSRVGFSVKHMGINFIQGDFKEFEGKIEQKKAGSGFDGSKVEFSAQAASVNTEVEKRDEHLRSADFFDAAKFAKITFVSTSVTKESGKKYRLVGDLTMHGVTKKVTLEMDELGTTTNPMSKKETAGFTITGGIKRNEFGVGASMPDNMLSELVNLTANLEVTKD